MLLFLMFAQAGFALLVLCAISLDDNVTKFYIYVMNSKFSVCRGISSFRNEDRFFMKGGRLLWLLVLTTVFSNPAKADPLEGLSLMTGLGQDLVYQGYNLAAQYTAGRWAFEYSHGWGINLAAHLPVFSLSSEEQSSGVNLYTNWTTGGGVGYYITDALHVHVELKAHNYTESLSGGPSVNYTVFSIGPGIFYDFYPFKKFLIQPSIRYWPNIGNTTGNSSIPLTSSSGATVNISPHSAGFFPNISIGWTF